MSVRNTKKKCKEAELKLEWEYQNSWKTALNKFIVSWADIVVATAAVEAYDAKWKPRGGGVALKNARNADAEL